jgi:hypothetical protein
MTQTYLDDKIITIGDFLCPTECNDFIDEINSVTNDQIHNFTLNNFKNHKYIDHVLTKKIYTRLMYLIHEKTSLSIDTSRADKWIMTGKYDIDQEFGLHTDTGLYYNVESGEKARRTLLIYLNDNFDGGQTSFYDSDLNHLLDIVPKKGMMLMFDIDLWHKGSKVLSGTKYWIGCEIIGLIN